MDATCRLCGAKHWHAERVEGSVTSPIFSHCCHRGKVALPQLLPPPPPIRSLLEDQTPTARHFRKHIRQYNCCFAFTSFRANNDNVNLDGRGPWTWKTGYQIYHTAGTLEPADGEEPSYAQLYFYDAADAINHQEHRNPNLRRQILEIIQQALHQCNPFCDIFMHARDILRQNRSGALAIRIVDNPETDQRRYNTPTVDEIAVLIVGNDQEANEGRDIILRPHEGGLQRISDLHSAYAPLHYVLLFPLGTPGWNTNLKLEPAKLKRMSQIQFYSYRLHLRDNDYPAIHLGGRLFQQYVCDIWVSADQNRLRWVQHNQPRLRAALYSGLEDVASQNDDTLDLNSIGQRVILPSSYIGGPRYMNQRFQDAVAVARHYHGFDLFITFTSNPSWDVLTSELLPGQTPPDRPDLVVRVFNMYKDALLDDIVNKSIFGHVNARVHSIEFQKRGLPHMHLLLSLFPRDRPQTPEDVDCMIRARWPDPEHEPVLFDIVKRCMVHGPCGPMFPNAPCMRDGKCSKGFPKPFQPVTLMTSEGYPTYACPDDGHTFDVGGFAADNRWIVPYNPYLLMRYNTHINVECVMSLAAAKYITKYTHKGPDRATIEIQRRNRDEVTEFKDSRYIAAAEAAWRLFEFPIVQQHPAVVRLQVHLPGHHLMIFDPTESLDQVLQRGEREQSMLTAFFAANRKYALARQYTYQEFPQHFVWRKKSKQWRPQQKGCAIGRLYFVSPTAGERFYLRMLLTTVKGPTSWQHLRTFNGVEHPSFYAASLARGLLQNDEEWTQCLTEAAVMCTGDGLRRLFALILRHCNPSRPQNLWNEFKDSLCDDLRLHLRRVNITDPSDDDIHDYGLFLLSKHLSDMGTSLSNFPNMPHIRNEWDHVDENHFLSEQLAYNTTTEHTLAIECHSQLNTDQRSAYESILEAVHTQSAQTFFLNGPAGTGKTFVYQALCHRLRAEGHIVLCVASSGIAALLLPGGRTAHSMFSIPVDNLCEDSVCNINKNSKQAIMMRRVRLIIWDEAAMQNRHVLSLFINSLTTLPNLLHSLVVETVDRSLRDIRSSECPFGGITVVLGGDFQQTLPVLVNGTCEDTVLATIQRSCIWLNISILNLTENMRLNHDPLSTQFSQWLLAIGHGNTVDATTGWGTISIPQEMVCTDQADLIRSLYGSTPPSSPPAPQYFYDRVLLAPLNDDVRKLNSEIIHLFPGELQTYTSADTQVIEPGTEQYHNAIPVEFLHSLNVSGLPLANLELKLGCPIILL